MKLYKNILLSIEKEEKALSRSKKNAVEEGYHMVSFLRNLLNELKAEIVENGFENHHEEISFFKSVKPEILAKLIYYNKIVVIESFCPSNIDMIKGYYIDHVKYLRRDYKKNIGCTEFYQYYRSGRTDKDDSYFRLGNINFFEGLNSFIVELDTAFSTLYDYKIAQILAFDLVHNFLQYRLEPDRSNPIYNAEIASKKDFSWTHSKNALIELIYALHISGSLSHGRGSLKNLGSLFEELFEIRLGDIHHAFHQMKFRAGEKASYLHFLKNTLEQYMENDV